MTKDRKAELLRVVCWLIVVILPTGAICLFFHIKDIRLVAVAIPLILIAERVYRKWLQKGGLRRQAHVDGVAKKPSESEQDKR